MAPRPITGIVLLFACLNKFNDKMNISKYFCCLNAWLISHDSSDILSCAIISSGNGIAESSKFQESCAGLPDGNLQWNYLRPGLGDRSARSPAAIPGQGFGFELHARNKAFNSMPGTLLLTPRQGYVF
jgi:hypothetical protein